MDTAKLMAISPLDGRYQEKVANLSPIFSEYGLIKYRLIVELRWIMALAEIEAVKEVPPLTSEQRTWLEKCMIDFNLAQAEQVKKIEATINHDVKAVEYFIKEQLATRPDLTALSEFIHFGCTSEDINNLAYGLMVKAGRDNCLLPALENIIVVLKNMAHQYASVAMLARTHGQPATPTTVGKEIANVIARLQRQKEQLANSTILGKINGATGNYSAFAIAYPDIDWAKISDNFITGLGLTFNPYTTQIEPHDTLSELFAILIRINTILIDFARDAWGYIAMNYFTQKSLAHEVGSSTMPHKVNPIDFENAEGNLGIANALFEHMIAKLPISRWQRDLSDSTVLRNIGVAFGHSLLAYQSLLKGIEKLAPNVDVITRDLQQHWEVLGEAIQTVMRRYQLEKPYEQLKAFTRGKQITQAMLKDFINQLALPVEVKQQLCDLTPETYVGYAETLANKI